MSNFAKIVKKPAGLTKFLNQEDTAIKGPRHYAEYQTMR